MSDLIPDDIPQDSPLQALRAFGSQDAQPLSLADMVRGPAMGRAPPPAQHAPAISGGSPGPLTGGLAGPQQAQGGVNRDIGMELQRVQDLQNAMNDRATGYQTQASALRDLLNRTAAQLEATPVGPTTAEKWGRIAAGVGAPTHTGSFGERMGNMGNQIANTEQQGREAQLAKQQLVAKYLGDAGQMGLQGAQMGWSQLSSQLNNANNRLTTLDIANQRQNSPTALIIRDSNGNPQVNPVAVQAAGAKSAAETSARMHAQMAGITGPLQDQMENTAERIASYKAPMPPQPRGGNPVALSQWYALSNMVQAHNPGYDQTQFPVKQKALSGFMGGTDGRMLDSINTATQHVGQLLPLAMAMQNGDIQLINQAKADYQRATGRPAPTNAALVQNVAAEEINKIAVGGPGAEPDRELMRAGLNITKASPQQAAEAIDQALGLMAGRTNSMRQRFKAGTHMTDEDFNAILLPETREAMESHSNMGALHGTATQTARELMAQHENAAQGTPPHPGWTHMTDAKGNAAWVSPDKKQWVPAQ